MSQEEQENLVTNDFGGHDARSFEAETHPDSSPIYSLDSVPDSREATHSRVLSMFPDLQKSPKALLSLSKLIEIHERFLAITDERELGQILGELGPLILNGCISTKVIIEVFQLIPSEGKCWGSSVNLKEELLRSFRRRKEKNDVSNVAEESISSVFVRLDVLNEELLKHPSEKTLLLLNHVQEKIFNIFKKSNIKNVEVSIVYYNNMCGYQEGTKPFIKIVVAGKEYSIPLDFKEFTPKFIELCRELGIYNQPCSTQVFRISLFLKLFYFRAIGDFPKEKNNEFKAIGSSLAKIIERATKLNNIHVEIYNYDYKYSYLNSGKKTIDLIGSNINAIDHDFIPYAKVIGLPKGIPDRFNLMEESFTCYLQSLKNAYC
jgi:hypothetical protein